MNYAIEMLGITKTFGTLVANDNVTLQVQKGEIHAILGENGAGKSTLMSILFGLYKADAGEIRINGETVSITNPNDANRHKIGMVHQHFKLVEVFTVLENIVLGIEPTKHGFLYMKDSRARITALSEQYGLHIDLDKQIKNITVGMQQRVEIMKMLYRNADILIFDEPTAVLTPQEIDGLFQVIRGFAKEGKSIVIITHKLDEIKQIADRCTVLRKGVVIGTRDVKDVTTHELAEMMVGREVSFTVDKAISQPKEAVFTAVSLNKFNKDRSKKVLNNVSFTVRAGEIVCIAGIEGNGQTELVRAVTGLDPHLEAGSKLILNAIDITTKSIRERFDLGLSHIPEDRQRHGLILNYNLAENTISNQYYKPAFQNHNLLDFEAIGKYADELIDKYDIRSGMGAKSSARSMSGGNQQKAIIARETSRPHNFLIASQPTRGLDVGAIEYVHKVLVKERDAGNGILVISLELDEVFNIADRILVMYNGQIVGELDPKQTTMNEIGLYMSGSKHAAEVAHE